MRQLIACVVLNYRVIARGKMVGHIDVQGFRANDYWV